MTCYLVPSRGLTDVCTFFFLGMAWHSRASYHTPVAAIDDLVSVWRYTFVPAPLAILGTPHGIVSGYTSAPYILRKQARSKTQSEDLLFSESLVVAVPS